MKNLRTIILAAGKGTRMKSGVTKVLHKVCGKPLVQYVMDIVEGVSSLKNCIILGHQSGQVADYISGKDYKIIIQEKLLGTADAVICAHDFFKGYAGDVLVLCGDAPLLRKRSVTNMIRRHKRTNAACTFLTAVVSDSRGYGRVIRGENERIIAIREEKDATEYEKHITEINVGAYCFDAKALFENVKRIRLNKKKKEFYLTDIVDILAGSGLKVESVKVQDPKEGLGVNTRQDLTLCESVIRHRILDALMSNGVTIVNPLTTFIYSGVSIGQDTTVHPFTVIEENVRIGKGCSVGPFAHLRPGVRLGNNVTVGNFAEVSRSAVGDNSVMKHFGFLGDTSVGKDVNIGAGVVTANYDGKHKNKTSISDSAFIGSDAILVAPLKVGRHAVIGAGSVITKNSSIPDKSVVVGIPGKIIRKNPK